MFFNKSIYKLGDSIFHAHHPIALSLTENLNKSILTVHNKGSIINDIFNGINDYTEKDFVFYRKFEIDAINKASIITFPSNNAKDLYINEIGDRYFNNKDIRVIYNGVDKNFIQSLKPLTTSEINNIVGKRNSDSKIFINIADHVQLKNVNILIDAFNIIINLLKQDVYLINIGEGPLTNILKEKINQFNLNKRVLLLGRLSNENVIRFLKASDILIMPSDKVVFDLVNLEALAAGIPLLLSKNGGNLEIIKEGENGFFIEKNNCESIVEAIINFQKSGLRKVFFNKNKLFEVSDMIKQYQDLYERLL